MKKVLIISPYFPPVNAADMHRVRTSLAYFEENGWNAQVVTVEQAFVEMSSDDLLLESVPTHIKIHKVKALAGKYTKKVGLGAVALRSLPYYRTYVNRLLKAERFDLIYFSTTQFPVCILGAYWKKRFKVPYVIDMQDPWHSDYYQDKPKSEQPPKYWFSYRLNKLLEPIAMKSVSGLISVSEDYIDQLKNRYTEISNIPAETITFGMYRRDIEIAKGHQQDFPPLLTTNSINIVYIGRGGGDMHQAIKPLFSALKEGLLTDPELYSRVKVYFIGTSYASAGQGKPTIIPLAKEYGLEAPVQEQTDRISYYHTLVTLMQSDALFVPGSDDPKYTASKIYPYLMTGKPILGIFHPNSSAINILKEFGFDSVYEFDNVTSNDIHQFISNIGNTPDLLLPAGAEQRHSARTKTALQCRLFEEALSHNNP